MNNCKSRTETFNDIISRYLEKVPFSIELHQLYLNIPDLKPQHFQKNDTIIIDIDFTISKMDTIISEIHNGHVYDLAHA